MTPGPARSRRPAPADLAALAAGRAPRDLEPTASGWRALAELPSWLTGHVPRRSSTRPEIDAGGDGRDGPQRSTGLQPPQVAADVERDAWGRALAWLHAGEQALLLREAAILALVRTPAQRPGCGPLVESVAGAADQIERWLCRELEEERRAGLEDDCGPSPMIGACLAWEPERWGLSGARALAGEALRLRRAPDAAGVLALAAACAGQGAEALGRVDALRATRWRPAADDPCGLDLRLALARAIALLAQGEPWSARREYQVLSQRGQQLVDLSNALFGLGFLLALFEGDGGDVERHILEADRRARRFSSRDLECLAALVPGIEQRARLDGRARRALRRACSVVRTGEALAPVADLCLLRRGDA